MRRLRLPSLDAPRPAQKAWYSCLRGRTGTFRLPTSRNSLFNFIGTQLVGLQVNIDNYKINPIHDKTGTACQHPNDLIAIYSDEKFLQDKTVWFWLHCSRILRKELSPIQGSTSRERRREALSARVRNYPGRDHL
jgi:hypothetical protein